MTAEAQASTVESRAEARRVLVDAYESMDAVRRRWPEVRQMKESALLSREADNFGPRYLKTLGA